MSITVEQILSALHTFDQADVRRVNQAAYQILKQTRSAANRAAKSKLHVGDKVSWSGRHGHQTGTIVKINRTRCIVNTGTGYARDWTVPMTMLHAA
jgi:putative ribosome biogenesis GTPase RsgA